MPFISDKRLYVDQDGNVTEEPPSSGRLLVTEGEEVSDELAKQYGLNKPKSSKADAEPETKQISGPPENKSQPAPGATKGS